MVKLPPVYEVLPLSWEVPAPHHNPRSMSEKIMADNALNNSQFPLPIPSDDGKKRESLWAYTEHHRHCRGRPQMRTVHMPSRYFWQARSSCIVFNKIPPFKFVYFHSSIKLYSPNFCVLRILKPLQIDGVFHHVKVSSIKIVRICSYDINKRQLISNDWSKVTYCLDLWLWEYNLFN